MQNHYWKKPLCVQDKLVNRFESFVYSVLPDDRLVTADEVYHLALASPNCPRDISAKAIKSGLTSLEEANSLILILGVSLERFIEKGAR